MCDERDKGKTPRQIWPFAIIATAVFLFRLKDFLIPVNRDCGLFSYGGWRILLGALPYRDFWDNKLPGVFYINAAAIKLFGTGHAGSVVFQMLYVTLAGWLFFAIARRLAGLGPTLAATILFVFLHSSYLFSEGGNYTETYTALPVLAGVWLLLRWSNDRANYALPVLAGAAAMIGGLIKQPAALVLPAMIVFVLATCGVRKGLKAAGALVGGAGLVAALLVGWMLHNGILHDAMDANLRFNRLYFIDAYTYGLPAALEKLLQGLMGMALPIVGAVAGSIVVFRRKGRVPACGWLLVPWFALNLVGLGMGGRFDHHYFLEILPSTLLLTAVLLTWAARSRNTLVAVSMVGIVLFVGPVWHVEYAKPRSDNLIVASTVERECYILDWMVTRRIGLRKQSPFELAASWVHDHTTPADSIYVWCWDTRIAFAAERRICSRYLHTHPLGAAGFDREARIAELRSDLERAMPKIIIDGSFALPTTAPTLGPGPVPPTFCPFFSLDGYEPIKEFVATGL